MAAPVAQLTMSSSTDRHLSGSDWPSFSSIFSHLPSSGLMYAICVRRSRHDTLCEMGEEDNAGALKCVHLLSECHHAEAVLKILDRQILVLYASLVTCQAATIGSKTSQDLLSTDATICTSTVPEGLPVIPNRTKVQMLYLQQLTTLQMMVFKMTVHDLDGMTAEFIGPGHKIYCNYHGGLNDGALPLSCVQVLPDDWSPYCNHMSVGAVKWENFKIAYKCKCQDGQNVDEQDELIELARLGGQDGQDEPNAPWMFNVYDVWYQDLCQVIHNLLRHTNIKDEMDLVPYQEFDVMNKQRCWEDFMSGNWAWEEAVLLTPYSQDKIISVNPMTTGATLVPIILGSDKTTVSVATRQMDYYLLYLSIGNMHNTTCCVHHDAVVLIGFLAMPKS
ncbi:hypothetical protein EDC04DRAFT_2964459 [Pisolithus marmoratus]|nr:hypothetical protein EDC04DRAFT_2964459 [Pisolithus marmoratus]